MATQQQNELIAELLRMQQEQLPPAAVPIAVPPAQPPAQPVAPSRPRRASGTAYTTGLYKVALLVALALVASLWYIGGAFTLATLASWGLPIVAWGLLAWLIPLGITALEIGTLAGRARIPMLWLIWAAVLAFDIATSAIGLLEWANGRKLFTFVFSSTDNTSAAICGLVGIAIALVPEPTARALLKELLS